jgi:leucyl-tRNA synthetase
MPVDQYIGGIEHAVLHLLYSRFYTKVLRDLGGAQIDETFTNMLTQGMVCMETQQCPDHGWLLPEEVKDEQCMRCGATVTKGRTEKMSKSKKNVVDPESLVTKYGADTARLFSLFAAPPEKDLEWNEEGVEGASRFLRRVWRLAADSIAWLPHTAPFAGSELTGAKKALRRKTHETIARVTGDIEARFHFNTAIAASMELFNEMAAFSPTDDEGRRVFREAFEVLLKLLSPMVPHIAEELWSALGRETMLADTPWPGWDAGATAKDSVTVVVQVNGRVRGRIETSTDAGEEVVREAAAADPNVSRHLEGKTLVKAVYVPGRILNLVVR